MNGELEKWKWNIREILNMAVINSRSTKTVCVQVRLDCSNDLQVMRTSNQLESTTVELNLHLVMTKFSNQLRKLL